MRWVEAGEISCIAVFFKLQNTKYDMFEKTKSSPFHFGWC